MKKVIASLLIVTSLFLLTGCESDKEYTIDDLTITLPSSFTKQDMTGFLAYLENDEGNHSSRRNIYWFRSNRIK